MLDNLSELITKAAIGFNISVPPPRSYAHILEEANVELGRINLQYEQMYHELMAKAAELDRMNKELNQLTEELDHKNKALAEMAARDGLTDLYNHRYFQDFMAQQFVQARRYGRALSLIMLDIDRFKQINDAQHQFGDSY
jgi:PleD family two-component response regulator